MEPMDLDDSSEYNFSKPQALANYSSAPFPSRHSTPSFASPSMVHPQRYDQHRTTPAFGVSPLSHFTPIKREPNALPRSYSVPANCQNVLSRASPRQTSFSRGATPLLRAYGETQRDLSAAASDSASCVSMETTSDRSNESDMEVGHTSWSPSRDVLHSGLCNVSLFRSEPGDEKERDSVLAKQASIPSKLSAGSVASWEPALSTVTAAATLKHRREKKASPSKSEISSSQQPIRKLGKKEALDVNKQGKDGKRSAFSCCGIFKLFFSSMFTASLAYAVFMYFGSDIAKERDLFTKIDAELLRNDMASKVFGQHIALRVIPDRIESYLHSFHSGDSSCSAEACSLPPLVLSFHGWTGVGKNFVSDIITSLLKYKTVTKLLVPYHFPHRHLDQVYETQAEHWVLSNVSKFHVNLFIFDEMDKATPGVIKGIQHSVAKLSEKNSFYSPTIFLLLSNTWGTSINHVVFQAMVDGRDRKSLTLADFSPLFVAEEDEKLWHQQLSKAISLSVPFLPLEKHHIVQCIRRDLVSKKLSTHSDIVNRVVQELSFATLSSGHQFSQTGCKRVSDKVNFVAFD